MFVTIHAVQEMFSFGLPLVSENGMVWVWYM